ncbi:MAG: T9SS type A sorting domain-containing protein [Bacteroidia bacterium]
MKKNLLLLLALAFALNSHAQVTFEHTYDSAATYNTCAGNVGQLMIVKFEVSGERYVKINRCGGEISIYSMGHVLLKTISLAGLPTAPGYGNYGSFLYLSEHLFDNDPGMEFMYVCDSGSFYTTRIYNEDGSLLFTTNGSPLVIPNVELQQYPIYNTSVGTKMILSYENGQAKVFGLAGTLTTEIGEANKNLLQKSMISNPYPNPTNSSTRVDYKLPEGIDKGVIIFYDLQGSEVKRYNVDRTFDHLLISTSELAAGTYYFQLQTTADKSEGKKVVIIK